MLLRDNAANVFSKDCISLMHCLITTVENNDRRPGAAFPHIAAVDRFSATESTCLPSRNKGFGILSFRDFHGYDQGRRCCGSRPLIPWLGTNLLFRDEEFARQTLSGLNPIAFESQYDRICNHRRNDQPRDRRCHAAEQALKRKRLFILDYHDLYLPYVKKVRELNSTTLYGPRTLFFLNSNDTLRLFAIELTRPPMDGKPHWKQVYAPSWDSTACWLWRLAKVHVLAHDAGYHQLVTWLRTHCVTEPYIIATKGQSVLCTQNIGCYILISKHVLARQVLNELCANDGLLIWDALEQWFGLCRPYYPNANLVESDNELQEWWNEIRTVGHAVNFGQYTYAGYFPNKSTIARTKMPTENPSDEDWKCSWRSGSRTTPMLPFSNAATKVMAVLDVLSNHSPDEEYLGEEMEPSWGKDPAKASDIDTAFFDDLDPEEEVVFDPPTPPEGFTPPPPFDDGPEETEDEIAAAYEELYGPAYSGISVWEMMFPLWIPKRVTKVVKGGKQLHFRAIVVVGDKQGQVGVALVKLRKSSVLFRNRLFLAELDLDFSLFMSTIAFECLTVLVASTVMLRPAAPGTGVIAGGVRIVLEMAGVENALGKQLGSKNALNNARATIVAVQKMKQFREVAQERGIPMEELWK
ncbi:30S ribosomal protein S5 [Hibiscus syriacus]|uniref:30S ribosomal protein S5 n=1 Tax=Hibiscus syriacus TaxID=106335 RepID=A0A6A3BTB3_HIBSY|nr:30S ribosomal protein S5 [Hibiscus syriacus]